jgi:F-type H+-transporting ATPase subunit b
MNSMIELLASATAGETETNPVLIIFDKFGVQVVPFVSQTVSFILVAILLKKFAFGPIQAMLEQRKSRIAEGEANLVKIQKQLADSEKNSAEAIAKANEEAQRLVNEAKESAAILSDRKAQEAIASAQQILAKAEAAAKAERDLIKAELKREFGRLVTATTSQVTGKVLNTDDQKRINDEALTKVEA